MTINDLKQKLLTITDKLILAKKRSVQQLNDDEATENKTNVGYTTNNELNALLGGKGVIDNLNIDLLEDANSSLNITD